GGIIRILTKYRDIDEDYLKKKPMKIKNGKYVEIEIDDTGRMVSAENLKNIYDPFTSPNQKKLSEGLGLTIASVAKNIETNKGGMFIKSEPQKGTCIKLYFPAVGESLLRTTVIEKKKMVDKYEISPDSPNESILNVLIAEDTLAIRRFLKVALEKQKYHVIDVEDGKEALKICKNQKQKIDLLITDVVMPVMGGIQLSEEMLRLYPNIKIIFISGFAPDNVLNEKVKQNCAVFLQKPFKVEVLLKIIHQTFEKS
ncbi:MAG: ATP-binding response regulator, partial [Promethearchaeota archaeon]